MVGAKLIVRLGTNNALAFVNYNFISIWHLWPAQPPGYSALSLANRLSPRPARSLVLGVGAHRP